jgi:hypothetical protein
MFDALASVEPALLASLISTSMVRSGGSCQRRPLGQLENSTPYLLESVPKRQNNVIIRP